MGIVEVVSERSYRNPVSHLDSKGYHLTLNEEQQSVVDAIERNLDQKIAKTYLIKGVTGSGKTEVYMELIAHMLAQGKQAIVLIPEIALTFQTVMRFYNRFGDRVSIMNSRLSPGERFDQFERAKNGDVDIMIGPRSALFTPFSKLGLIIIDEEHESSYKSETLPRYHARETAIERARMCGASVVLGSATPSVESYYKAKTGEYELLVKAPCSRKTTPESRGRGFKGRVKSRQPFHFKCTASGADGGPPEKGTADDAFYQPERGCRLCLLQSLRSCVKMSALRCVSKPACDKTASGGENGLSLLRI